jgi:hypothetical protein
VSPDPYAQPPLPPSSYGQPPYGTPGAPPPDDTMAWASIATSVASWLTCCCAPIPFVGMIVSLGGLLLAVAGLVCGILAYQQAKRVSGRTDLPIIGMVIGALRLVLTVGIVVVALVTLGTVGLAAYFQQAGH